MSMNEDQYYEYCESHHHEPVDGCISCEARAESTYCTHCRVINPSASACTVSPDGQHALFDGFDVEKVCKVQVATTTVCMHGYSPATCSEFKVVPAHPCGDPVTTPGAVACDFHQREIDAVEAGKIYQRLVAVR